MIRFLAPMWLLAVVPVLALAAVYVWRQYRRRSYAVRFTNVDLLRTLAPKGLGYRRHLAAGAFLLCLLTLACALARPSMDAKQPLERATVMIAIDVSLSMRADDVAPTRIQAAQEAAKEFVKTLPDTYNVGLVSFSKAASVLVSPGKDKAAVLQAIDGLQLAEATATGEAVFTCLSAIQSVPAAAAAANVPVSTIAFGTDNGTVNIQGQLQRVPVDKPSLQKLAETTRGHYYEAASLTELKQVYQDMGSSIGYRTVPREITQWYVGIGLLFAFAAAGMSLLWTSRLP